VEFDVAGRLNDRVALVTGGGTSGQLLSIGRAVCLLLASAGAQVGVMDRDPDACAATVSEVEKCGGEAMALVGDVRSDEECRTAVETLVARWGRVDILVNNAGVGGPPSMLTELSDDAWQQVFDVNASGVLRMSRYALPSMPPGGCVVNVSSAAVGRPGLATAYSASKAAVEALTRATAVQFGPRGIRANCVSPGALWTDMVARQYADANQAEARARRRAEAVIDAEGTAWDAAFAVLFLAGAESRWITGQVLAVDGGAPLRAR